MNKLIRELKSHPECWDEGQHGPPWFNSDKFAELIVAECVEQIYPQWIKEHRHIDPTNLADAVMRVKQHFGVDE